MAPSIIPGKMIIFLWKLAHILFTMYELQINHEKFGDVIINCRLLLNQKEF